MQPDSSTFSKHAFLIGVYRVSLTVVGLYAVLYIVLQSPMLKLSMLLGIGLLFLIGFLVASTGKFLSFFSHYYITCCYLFFCLNMSATGGLTAPGFAWFLICPLTAFLLLSTRSARFWLILVVITSVVYYIFDGQLVFDNVMWGKLWYLISYSTLFTVLYLIIRIFRREASKKNAELTFLNFKLKEEGLVLKRVQEEILRQSVLLREAEAKASERSKKLSHYLDQLVGLQRMEEIHSGNLEYALPAILQFLQQSLSLNNVALWHLSDDGNSVALKGYAGDSDEVYERAIISRTSFPEAFEMLQTGAILNANTVSLEAEQMERLFQFSHANNSMVNCPYFLEGKFGGFISCRGSSLEWCTEDILFIRAISDTISLAFKSHVEILQQRMLEEKQLEITEMNESLERKVHERTWELDKRNKQLTHFSFTNAHHIRGPICRLLGLEKVLANSSDSKEVLKIARYMSTSILELDAITRETSKALDILLSEDG